MNKKTVLIVEDDMDLGDTFRDYFECRGFEVVGQIHDETKALELIKKLKPDLVILDTVISRQARHLTIRELQAASPRPKIFTVTSYDYDFLGEVKVDASFRKPFSLSKFTKALSSLKL
jgi:DNA-binding response OmpR family regulator